MALPAAGPIWKGRTAFLMPTGRPSHNAPEPGGMRLNSLKAVAGLNCKMNGWRREVCGPERPHYFFALLVTIASGSVKLTTTEHHGY